MFRISLAKAPLRWFSRSFSHFVWQPFSQSFSLPVWQLFSLPSWQKTWQLFSLPLAITVALSGISSVWQLAPVHAGELRAARDSCSCKQLLTDASGAQPSPGGNAKSDSKTDSVFLEDFNLRYVAQSWGECRKESQLTVIRLPFTA